MTMKKADDFAKEEWSRDEYYFGYDEVWKQLVEYTRMVQVDAVEACAKVLEEWEPLVTCRKELLEKIRGMK